VTSSSMGYFHCLLARTPRPGIIFALFLANVAVWSIYSAISNMSSALHQDLTEAYAWGHEFQLGYFKHPPFWAWIAGIWFSFMPHRDWAFQLLALLNANIGLLGAWKLIGLFADGEKRVAATLLLLLTPFYTFLAGKYNANSIFLSLWPWTAYFLVRSVEEASLLPSAMLGTLAAADILSKYYAAILLVVCLIASIVHPNRRRYYASARPLVALGVCMVLVAPHIWWLMHTGFLPFHYFASKTSTLFFVSVGSSFTFLAGCLALQILVFGAVLLIKPFSLTEVAMTARERWRDSRFRCMVILALGPAILTAIMGPALHLRLDTNMGIGIFCLAPLLLLELNGPTEARRARQLSWVFVLVLTVGAVLASPLVAYITFGDGRRTTSEPRYELAVEGTRIWHQITSTPLEIVTGNTAYASAVAFYSEDRPHQLIDFDFAYSPWLTKDDILRHGIMVICVKDDARCLASSAAIATARTTRVDIELSHAFAGRQAPPTSLVLTIVPPDK
jgi:4-amino-4-deoxy-L-arabinose transferase-like glycosyltransferase